MIRLTQVSVNPKVYNLASGDLDNRPYQAVLAERI